MSRIPKKRMPLSLLMLLSVLLILMQAPVHCDGEAKVEGVVKEHSTGTPIPHAEILVLRRSYYWRYRQRYEVRWERWFQGKTDSNGSFVLELDEGETFLILAYYDDPSTPGFDYVPSMKSLEIPSSGKMNVTLELWDGASIFLEGEALFVETTKTAQSTYSVLDPDSKIVIQFDGFTLKYGEGTVYPSFLRLSPNLLIVPANIPFMVEVDSVITVGKKTSTRNFLIDVPGHFILEKADIVQVSLREFSLPSSLSAVTAEASEVGLMLEEREEEGFYLAVERQRMAQVNSLVLEAENLLDQGSYEASFTRLRKAYVVMSNLRNWLNGIYTDALISVFLLIPFLAFTATAISYLLFEEKAYEISSASLFYSAFLLALYLLYPGSRLIETSLFLGASLISIITIQGFSTLVTRFLRGGEFKGRLSVRNMVVPIFSIAKRSLRRRKLRFALTLFSVMILVSSFIALTSFTTGFGLTFGRVSSQTCLSMGVLVRAPKSQVVGGGELFWFSPLENSSIEWFESRPETSLVVPKYENLPHRQYLEGYDPLGHVYSRVPVTIHLNRDGVLIETNWVPIFGIVGVIPSAEAEVLRLDDVIVEGRYLSDEDEDGVLISAKLKEKMSTTVGEALPLRMSGEILELKIIGIFEDGRFEDLMDLDGQSLLPRKIINVNTLPREPDEPISVIEDLAPCLTDEALVVTRGTALKIDGMWLSRLDIISEEEDLKEYAKMMALNKGFRAWASTEEGVYLAELASYFEGKGLPITIPWLIVVLNVVVTMLNSLYERKKEVYIYSSIGMNPSHISGIFIAEAAVIGVLGGGIGYLVGLGWYKAMSLLALALQVRQKVSALWSLAGIAVSMAAVLVGGLTALRGSVIITPSLRRKWSIERGPHTPMEPLELNLPIGVAEVEIEEFVEFVMRALRSSIDDWELAASQIKEDMEETEDESIRSISFIYRSAAMKLGGAYTKNRLILRKERGSEAYTVRLLTEGNMDGIHKAGSFIRKIVMEWSIKRGKL